MASDYIQNLINICCQCDTNRYAVLFYVLAMSPVETE